LDSHPRGKHGQLGLAEHESHFLYLDEHARLGHHLEYMWLDASASAFFDTIPRN
jgi:hypothetical protein